MAEEMTSRFFFFRGSAEMMVALTTPFRAFIMSSKSDITLSTSSMRPLALKEKEKGKEEGETVRMRGQRSGMMRRRVR